MKGTLSKATRPAVLLVSVFVSSLPVEAAAQPATDADLQEKEEELNKKEEELKKMENELRDAQDRASKEDVAVANLAAERLAALVVEAEARRNAEEKELSEAKAALEEREKKAEQEEQKKKDKTALTTWQSWCADSGTLCWHQSRWFSGLRIIAEPEFGGFLATEFENEVLTAKVGVELGIAPPWISLHGGVIPPLKVTFDEDTMIDLRDRERRQVGVDWGWAVGVSALDGILAGGIGAVYFDPDDFADAGGDMPGDVFGFIQFQGASALRAVIKRLQ